MIRASLFFALRQLSRKSAEKSYRRIRGAVAGIALALIPAILVLQVSNGLIRGITERYIEVGSFHMQARAYGGFTDEEFSEAAGRVRRVKGVKAVYEISSGLGLLQTVNGRTGATVQALPADIAATDEAFNSYVEVVAGSFDLADETALMLSRPLADRLGAGPGDEVRLLTARSTSTGRFILKQSVLNVRGIYTTGYHDLDEMTVLISAERGKKLFREDGSRVLGIKIDKPFGDLSAQRIAIQDALGSQWYVFTWYQLQEARYSTFESTKNLLLLIMGIIILVAGVNISGSLIMLVMEKERDISILRSCGVSRSTLTGGFVALGAIAGIVGTGIGAVIGIFLAVNVNAVITAIEKSLTMVTRLVNAIAAPDAVLATHEVELLGSSFYLETIPIVLRPGELIAVCALSIGVAVIASISPARRAAKLQPVEVLRRH